MVETWSNFEDTRTFLESSTHMLLICYYASNYSFDFDVRMQKAKIFESSQMKDITKV